MQNEHLFLEFPKRWFEALIFPWNWLWDAGGEKEHIRSKLWPFGKVYNLEKCKLLGRRHLDENFFSIWPLYIYPFQNRQPQNPPRLNLQNQERIRANQHDWIRRGWQRNQTWNAQLVTRGWVQKQPISKKHQ
jgi:hypothetical protein